MTLGYSTRNLAIGIAAGALLLGAQSARAADDNGSVQGVVSNASGQPVAGAFVKLKNAERRLTFMVISQDQGRFEAKDLPVGRYTVQGVGGGFQSAVSAPVPSNGNLVLQVPGAVQPVTEPAAGNVTFTAVGYISRAGMGFLTAN